MVTLGVGTERGSKHRSFSLKELGYPFKEQLPVKIHYGFNCDKVGDTKDRSNYTPDSFPNLLSAPRIDAPGRDSRGGGTLFSR